MRGDRLNPPCLSHPKMINKQNTNEQVIATKQVNRRFARKGQGGVPGWRVAAKGWGDLLGREYQCPRSAFLEAGGPERRENFHRGAWEGLSLFNGQRRLRREGSGLTAEPPGGKGRLRTGAFQLQNATALRGISGAKLPRARDGIYPPTGCLSELCSIPGLYCL